MKAVIHQVPPPIQPARILARLCGLNITIPNAACLNDNGLQRGDVYNTITAIHQALSAAGVHYHHAQWGDGKVSK